MDENEKLAYLAGIIDGEGYIGIHKIHPTNKAHSPSYSLRLDIANTDEKLVLWLKDNFGGKIYKQVRCPNCNPSWYWTLGSKKTFLLLRKVKDLSVIKQNQITLAIEFQKKTIGHFYRWKPIWLVDKQEAYFKELKKLHNRGCREETKEIYDK